jgi:hypothetical protein
MPHPIPIFRWKFFHGGAIAGTRIDLMRIAQTGGAYAHPN